MPSSLNGTGVTFNDATTLQSGNIPAANLGSGTANSSVFLRGDKVWATVPASAPSTTDVLNATAGASVGAVGTYALLGRVGGTSITPGLTLAGSSLRYTGFCGLDTAVYTNVGSLSSTVIQQDQNTAPAGTWRCMGTQFGGASSGTTAHPATVWLRIS